ncbi:E3 ubiquitin-protein ligase TRIM63-like [Thunnus maccoyii]|uniref:E3 ubiquitin-protein ligase TRIM63-like n=1 Tax=Thunnus maccoyii TaxID=8240 RepID=UPI001C4DCC19|nr:E3 ubiquitin-protein ligase TRIM63-like [Thunnus maccoyii]
MDIQTAQLVRPVGAMENLEQQLSCPICLDMFTKPVVILPCQHNLCRGCAGELYESKNRYTFSGGSFRCPTCRFEVLLDRHGVYGLQRNLLVENIIDIYKQQQERQRDDEPPLKDKEAKEPKCKEHEEERINIYCITCQTPTCSMCKVFGQHKDCQVSPLHAVYQSQKSELRAAVELLAAANSSVQSAVTQMDDSCTLIRQNGELQKRRLGESFDLLFAILEERKQQLLERVGQVEEEKLAALRALAERYKLQLQSSNQLQEKLTESAQRCGAAEFLLSSKQLLQEAEQAAKAPLTGPEPADACMDHLTIDTLDAEELIANMGFIQDQDQDLDQNQDQDQALDQEHSQEQDLDQAPDQDLDAGRD